MKFLGIVFLVLVVLTLVFFKKPTVLPTQSSNNPIEPTTAADLAPLTIQAMRNRSYPGSDIKIEETLANGSNYSRYIASYMSDGLKIYALLTLPDGAKPTGGWPVIVFNHGYIPPDIYRTTERYIAYTDAFSRDGYIVFKPDYRGNGNSEGQPEGAYYSPAYAIDDLNAIASIKKYKDANPGKIGVWGHSMGGNITLRDLVVDTTDIKAAVIWGGVVGSYNDLVNKWHRISTYRPVGRELALRNLYRQQLFEKYASPSADSPFWKSADPTNFIQDITAPIQLHHGLADDEVPPAFSQELYDKLKQAGKSVELYTYEGADHNISDPSFSVAMQRSVEFFDKYLK